MQLMNNEKVLAQSLRGARKKRNLTQIEAARRAGLLPKTISLLENHPEKSSIASLMKYLTVLDRELFLSERDDAMASADEEW